jgi:hypothetical protein
MSIHPAGDGKKSPRTRSRNRLRRALDEVRSRERGAAQRAPERCPSGSVGERETNRFDREKRAK